MSKIAPYLYLSVLLVVGSVAAQRDARTVVAPDDARPDLPFSPAIAAGPLVYLSGGVARDRSQDIRGQTRQVLAQLRRVLAAAELGLEHAVQSNVYLTDSRHFAAMNEVYREHFANAPPTRATVESDLAVPGALIEIALVAARADVPRDAIVPGAWPAPTRPYSWGVAAGDTVFVSGMVSRDVPRGELVLGDVAVQTRQVLENVRAVLAARDMTMTDVVRSTVFLADARDFAAMNAVYREFFGGDSPPARATVRTRLMNPDLSVEIQCVAVRDPARRVAIADGARPSSSPFSPSISAGGRQFLAGAVGRGPDGFAPGDVAAQTRQTLLNLRGTLVAAGRDFDDVVESVVYLSDARHFAAFNAVYRELLPNAPPARTTVGAQLMSPDALVEIAMTAVGG